MWRKKGRPKKNKLDKDLGTPELQQKRLMRFTDDPLDLCFERNIMTENQYNLSLRLRALFYSIFGHLKLKAYDPENLSGASVFFIEDEKEIRRKKIEYDLIMKSLSAMSFDKMIYKVCITGEKPSFLMTYVMNLSDTSRMKKAILELDLFKNAISALEKVMEAANAEPVRDVVKPERLHAFFITENTHYS